jgi:hypothetical protein
MTHQPKIVVVADPRTFDGTPYAVAERAVSQIAGLLGQALDIMPETRSMVLNADLERQMALGNEPDPTKTLLAGRILAIEKHIAEARKQLEIIQRAAAYDPKHPPRA